MINTFQCEHVPILDRELFNGVQDGLKSRLNRHNTKTFKSGALLQGLLFDSNGNRMTPVHANKGGLRYRYYQSWVLNHGHKAKAGTVSRVPAQAIENAILEALKVVSFEADQSGTVELNAKHFLESVERLDVFEGQLVLTLKDGSKTQEGADQETVINTMLIPWTKNPFPRKREITGSVTNAVSRQPMLAEVRSRVLKAMAQGRVSINQLVSQRDLSIHDIAQRQGLSDRSVRSTLSLALIAPDIVDALIDGRLPPGVTVTRMSDLSPDWAEQKLALGLAQSISAASHPIESAR